jgi:hypothetical protein
MLVRVRGKEHKIFMKERIEDNKNYDFKYQNDV